jgi:outer membrane lipopolysaccharide assembly protein LptE/RlpB
MQSQVRTAAFALCFALAGCGYHTIGRSSLLPKEIRTIAVPTFTNATARTRISDALSRDVARELITRSRYRIVADPADADAVLTGGVLSYSSFPTILAGGRAAGVQVIVTVQARLTRRDTNQVLSDQPNIEARERYEVSVDQVAYFDESAPAIDRLSRDVARSVVSAILENF